MSPQEIGTICRHKSFVAIRKWANLSQQEIVAARDLSPQEICRHKEIA
jgi:hypothetical protein